MQAAIGSAADYPLPMARSRRPITVSCVFNDPSVRERCLDRSIDALRHEAPDVEYLPIDNVDGTFSSAGKALNFAASQARHEHLVFVHQDVYLHSLRSLEEAAALLGEDSYGMLGASGINSDGRLLGRIRDRVILLGQPTASVASVASLDEVLFMVPRKLLLDEPLSEDADFSWHAYAVEYGLRIRRLGLRVGVTDIPLTHNSLSTNVDNLDVAHAAIATRYPEALPLRTTCGIVRDAGWKLREVSWVVPHLWRYRWLKKSASAYAGRRAVGGGTVVLSDIRFDIDELAAGMPRPVLVLSVDDLDPSMPQVSLECPELLRYGVPFRFATCRPSELGAVLSAQDPEQPVLVTNLQRSDLAALRATLAHQVLGYHEGMGFWCLLGPLADRAVPGWRSPRSRPLGMPPGSPATASTPARRTLPQE